MPSLAKIEILRQEKVRRAKLYFVREQVNKKTKKRRATEKNIMFDLAPKAEEDLPAEASAQAGVVSEEEAPVEEEIAQEAPVAEVEPATADGGAPQEAREVVAEEGGEKKE